MKPIKIGVETEMEFWKKYIDILQTSLPKRNRLTEAELKVMAYIMAGEPYKDYFKQPYKDKTCKDLKVKYHNLHMLGGKLRSKGWLIDKLPPKPLRLVQEYIKSNIADKKNPVVYPFSFEFVINLSLYNGGS